MGSKIVLGILIGFLAGGAAKALTTANANPALAPAKRGWFNFSATVTPMLVVVWIIYTFGAYSAKFGLMAIGEVAIGALLSGLLTNQVRSIVAVIALPVAICAWLIL